MSNEFDRYGQLIELVPIFAEKKSTSSIPQPLEAAIIPAMPEDYMRGRNSQWPTFLRNFLNKHPLCWGCGRKATTGHHIVPYHEDPLLELVESNIAPVDLPCHFVLCHLGNWRLTLPKRDLLRHLTQHVMLVNQHKGE